MIRFGIHSSAVIDAQGILMLPESTVIEPQVALFVGPSGRIELGERNTLYPQVSLRVDKGWIRTGKDVSIGSGTHIYEPRGGLEIGDNVLIAGGCLICGVQHGFARSDLPMRFQPTEVGPIVIESDVWLGMGVILMPGITIGEGSIVGAGSVVTKSIPKNCIAYGSPCKVQRKRTDDES